MVCGVGTEGGVAGSKDVGANLPLIGKRRESITRRPRSFVSAKGTTYLLKVIQRIKLRWEEIEREERQEEFVQEF